MRKSCIVWLSALCIAFSSPVFAADPPANNNEEARMMVHLLDYIAVDYGMSVQEGKVVSNAEYAEMKEFISSVKSISGSAPTSMQSDILLLESLIAEKASQSKVASVASNIKHEIIAFYRLEIAPKRWPKIDNGKRLFALQCQSCHGKQGKGDGLLASGLNPSPTNFHHPDKANGLSPFQAYNTIRLGVEGTGMRAFNELSDDEVWDLAFYVLSLPHQGEKVDPGIAKTNLTVAPTLKVLASSNNQELVSALNLDLSKPSLISALRLFPQELVGEQQIDYLGKAKSLINASVEAYQNRDFEKARTLALTAYLEGVEPVEIQLRANDASLVANIESSMSAMRSSIEKTKELTLIQQQAQASIEYLGEAEKVLKEKSFSGWLAFLLSSSIILREGLEAFLVVITVLGIVRSLNIKSAAAYVHSGWIGAILSGFLLWLAADSLFTFTGAQREVMEGAIALFAVGVLLYVGFWMHSKSEAGKWQAYVKTRIAGLAKKENLVGLAFLSFLVVFREAFESVLFLSALNMEVGQAHQGAFIGGIVSAFAALGLISVLLLKYSKRIPITQLFKYSAMIISFLAVVLTGKGIHALQEAGILGISSTPFQVRWPLFGVYPAWESIVAQLLIFALIIFLWNIGNKVMKKPICETEKDKIQSVKEKQLKTS
jgi:high-affinity iron transporter